MALPAAGLDAEVQVALPAAGLDAGVQVALPAPGLDAGVQVEECYTGIPSTHQVTEEIPQFEAGTQVGNVLSQVAFYGASTII